MGKAYHVVDLFAGPGGLAEGFSSVRDAAGKRAFVIALSVEKEASAHRTLLLRAFLRQFEAGFPKEYYEFLGGGEQPNWNRIFPEKWAAAQKEALQLELGTPDSAEILNKRLDELVQSVGDRTIVIGGPPCQAYSLVGRNRNKGKEGYKAENDPRHFLYREYISILEHLRPAAFVMENVKGMLSSSVGGKSIFTQVLGDLRKAAGEADSYRLMALLLGEDGKAELRETARPRDFVIHSEKFGIPQARHRVIIIGLRADVAEMLVAGKPAHRAAAEPRATLRHVLATMPSLRSGLSAKSSLGRVDSAEAWKAAIIEALGEVIRSTAYTRRGDWKKVNKAARSLRAEFENLSTVPPRQAAAPPSLPAECPANLAAWLSDPRMDSLPNHSSRSHMPTDLARYLFAALYAEHEGRSPVNSDFPALLAPKHKNWDSGKFPDRFKVQLWDNPSTTITSHLSKDGHYFIHPDPSQCRVLTVREVARLQTFPDNYVFLGNQSEQFVQVGNAVPPFLARQIASALWSVLAGENDPAEP